MDTSPMENLSEYLPEMKAEAKQLRNQAAELEGRAESIEKIISGIEALFGRKATPGEAEIPGLADDPGDNGTGPRGTAAVRAVMNEQPGRVFRTAEIFETLKSRGWINPEVQHPRASVEAAINRLYRVNGELERVGPGAYRYKGGETEGGES